MNVPIRMSLLLALPLVAGLAVLTPRAAVADTSSGMGIAAPADDAPPPPETGADPKEGPAPAPTPVAPKADPMTKIPAWAPPPLAGETREEYEARTGWTYSPM